MKASLGSAMFVLAMGCGGARNYRIPPPAQDDSSVGPGDVFNVAIIGDDEVDGQYRISADGTIYFPYLGRVEVAGLPPSEIAEVLATRLVDEGFYRDPQVRVFLEESSRRISVMGEVQNPGTYPVSSGMTVVEAISVAGGFTSIARQGNVRVTRREDGESQTFRVPVDDITNGDEPDFPVQAGDIVFVEQRPF